MSAAVSPKFFKSVPKCRMSLCPCNSSISAERTSRCKLTKVASIPSTSGRNDVNGIDRLWSLVWAGRPDQARPIRRRLDEPSRVAQSAAAVNGAQRRRCGRYRCKRGRKGERQTQKRAVQVELRECMAARRHLHRGSERAGGARATAPGPPANGSSRPARRNERRVAAELDRVAKSLLSAWSRMALAGDVGRPQPQRLREIPPFAFHVGCLPLPFVFLPSVFKIADQQTAKLSL